MHARRGQFQEIAITAAANVYASPRVAPLLVLGFASGLPLALTSGTLQAWATVENVPLQQIGFLTLVGTAYTLKFLWAPLVDRYAPPLLGRRRGWMLLTQVLLALGIMAMGLLSPSSALLPLALLAVTVAFLSATQDIAFDAYCTDVLRKDERGGRGHQGHGLPAGHDCVRRAGADPGGPMAGLGLYLHADGRVDAGLRAGHLVGARARGAGAAAAQPAPAVAEPLREFFTRRGALAVLLLIVLYKLGDAFAGALSTTFLRGGLFADRGRHGQQDHGHRRHGGGRAGRRHADGALDAVPLADGLRPVAGRVELAYWLIAVSPRSLWLMAAGVGLENLCGGLGTAAFVGLLMALCRQRFSATQFALLSALSAVGRTYLAGPLTPPLVELFGWPGFFLITVLIAVPGLVLLYLLRDRIEDMVRGGDSQ